MNKQAVTMLELIVVLIIISVLAILALPPFKVAKENALIKEAQANLKLIQAAEKIYGLESMAYQGAGNTAAVNSVLLLDIPVSTNKWDYSVDSVTATNFRARALRQPGGTPIWCIRRTELEPVSDATCN